MTEREPLLRVVRGQPTAEEAAALAVVLAAKLAARPAEDRARGRSPAGGWADRARARSPAGGWADRARALHVLPAPGPGAWKSSARPT